MKCWWYWFMSCVFLFGGSLCVSVIVHYPYYWCIKYKRMPRAVNTFHLLFRTARNISEIESVACSGGKDGRCLPAVARQTLDNQVMLSFIWYQKKTYMGTYWYTHTDRMTSTSSGACFIFLRKQSVAETWCILWQTCFEVKDPRSIPVDTSFVFVFEHSHAVKYTSFWLHLIMQLII